ncbi:hypothetical protein HYW76_02140 [Candidatus Pacearchaeota archaeon]|nr:hypothetical protein [Candidatus Pacearchaeota archaeon]
MCGKREIEKEMADFFKNINSKKKEEIKKIKRKAMHYKIRLKYTAS